MRQQHCFKPWHCTSDVTENGPFTGVLAGGKANETMRHTLLIVQIKQTHHPVVTFHFGIFIPLPRGVIDST